MEKRVFEIMANILNVPFKEINFDSSPLNIEQWDSLKHIDLVLALEEEFGTSFDGDTILELTSARLICDFLAGQLNDK